MYWTITAPEGKIIRVDFEELDIENEVYCRNDYLRFYDGESKTDREIRTYCGTSQPYPIQTTSNKLYIHFHSNEQYARKGFRLTWKAIDVVTRTVSTTTPYPRGSSLTSIFVRYTLKYGILQSQPKSTETIHFYCKITQNRLLFLKLSRKQAETIPADTASLVPPVRPNLATKFKNDSVSTKMEMTLSEFEKLDIPLPTRNNLKLTH